MDQIRSFVMQNPRRAAIVCFVVAVLCFIGAFGIPSWATNSAEAAAISAIDSATQRVSHVEERLNGVSSWFLPSYLQESDITFQQTLQSALSLIQGEDGANAFLSQGRGGWPDERLIAYAQAQSLAIRAIESAEQIDDKIDFVENERESSREILINTQSLWATTSDNLQTVLSTFTNNADSYLTKYRQPLQLSLDSSSESLESAIATIRQVEYLLPLQDTVCLCGDPRRANSLLQDVNTSLGNLQAQIDADESQIQSLQVAFEQADILDDQARLDFVNATEYVNDLRNSTGYWLNQISDLLANAEVTMLIADTALSTSIEGKFDYLVAYTAANQSINFSQQAIVDADAEVSLAREVLDRIDVVSIDIQDALRTNTSARNSELTLSSFHAQDTWSQVNSNVSLALDYLVEAEAYRDQAIILSSMQTQRFQDASDNLNAAANKVNDANRLSQAVIDLESILEGYRNEWEEVFEEAGNAIDHERPRINQYGSYNSRAQDDFNAAQGLLNQSAQWAATYYYQNAVDKANDAIRIVSGTGARAYQSKLDSDAAATRVAEEANASATRSAEALRRAQEDDDDSSFSFDFGGSSSSSCCDSDFGGSSYDGGGFSDYGGSYDGGGFDSGGSYDGGDW